MKGEGTFKNRFFVAVYAIIFILTVLVALRFITIYFFGNPKAANPVIYDKYYVMISDNHQSGYWKSVYEGACEYGMEKNVFVEDLASSFSSELSKEELMRIAIASRVDGIIVSADDSEELTELINEANMQGIPVVTMYNDAPNSNRISYVGVDNYNIGKEYGRQAVNVARGIYAETQEEDINVVVLVDQIPSSDQMMIYSSVQETFEADGLSSKLRLSMVKIDSTNAFSVEETIRDLFISDDIPAIIICLSELDTTCVYQAVIDYNKVGLISILGYYDSDSILQGISRNIINSTIKIDAVQMGQYCVDSLVEYDNAGFTSQYFSVDFEVINSYNVASYMEETNEN